MRFDVVQSRIAVAGLMLVAFAGANGADVAGGMSFPESRPRVGLVLGGGGAKGAAHIGVLQVLDELRIPVDCVAGTSMGALVGGTFATGTPPRDIETAVLAIDWAQTIGGQDLRNRTPIDRKLSELSYSNTLQFGFAGGRLRTPGGLLATQDIEDEIWRLVSAAQFTDDFDELPIPFRAIATDLVGGEMVVLDSGDLAVAMRASMAIPGAFAPVHRDGRLLADGGMMRNLPVDVAREMCADVVIAVWLSSPAPAAEDMLSALALVGRSLDVMVGANQRAQIETLTARDVGIEVPMGDIGSGDFHRVADAISRGRQAAVDDHVSLSRLSLPDEDYRAWRRSLGRTEYESFEIDDVRIVGLERVNSGYVRAALREALPGHEVDASAIAADAERVFALGDFEQVGYRVTGPDNARTLEIRPMEKSWGPDFLRFDLGLAANGDHDLSAILRADHERTWINSRGAQWHNTVQFGQQTILSTDFYQPLDIAQRFFVQPIARYDNTLEDLYLDDDRVASYFVRQLYGQLDAGMNLGTRAQLRVGLRHGWHDARLDTGIPGLPEGDREADTSIQFRAVYDTRDSVALPTRGTFLNARYVRSRPWLGSDLDYSLVEGVVTRSFKLRGNSLSLILGGGDKLSGDVPVTQQIELGGIRTFPGLRPGELRGNDYWFAGTSYLWRLVELQPLFGQALYAGLRLQAGEMRERFDGIDDGTLYGVSGSVSGRTPVGAFLLSLGYVENGSLRLQFTLGRPVAEGSILDEIQ